MGAHQGRRLLRLVGALSAAVLLAATAVACAGSTGGAKHSPSPTPRRGGTYDYPLKEDPGSFDHPGLLETGDASAVLHQVYEGLVRYELQPDGSLKTAPCLAESWKANADATVWTFALRRGVMFQPPVSREVTAADVVADLRYIADPARRSGIAYMLAGIEGTNGKGYAAPARLGVEALDRYTVRFTLQRPISEFPDMLGGSAFWLWPADYRRTVGAKAYGRHPVGTGPYLFLRATPGSSIDLARNDEWWDKSGGPYIDTIHYEVFSSVSSMMLAFQKGMIDWTWLPKGQVPASRSLPQVKSGRWKVESTPDLALGYLVFNMNDAVVGGRRGLRLRQALAYGCDRQAVIDAATDGVFLLPDGLVPPGVPGSREAPTPYRYDPAKARELLKQMGPVTLRLVYPIDRLAQSTAESLTASCAKIGVTIKARGLEWNDYLAYVEAGKSQSHLVGWLADYPSMDNFLYPEFESSSSPTSLCTFYSSPDVDALLLKARATPDRQVRAQLYADAERKILADCPVVPVFVYADYRLYSNRVANVEFNSMAWVDMWRAWVK